MDFSQRKLEQKRPVFLPHTQCDDAKDTAHNWRDGEGFRGDGRALEGGIMVAGGRDGDPRDPRRIPVRVNGTGLAKRHFGQASAINFLRGNARIGQF